jgi:hypothetical protein
LPTFPSHQDGTGCPQIDKHYLESGSGEAPQQREEQKAQVGREKNPDVLQLIARGRYPALGEICRDIRVQTLQLNIFEGGPASILVDAPFNGASRASLVGPLLFMIERPSRPEYHNAPTIGNVLAVEEA